MVLPLAYPWCFRVVPPPEVVLPGYATSARRAFFPRQGRHSLLRLVCLPAERRCDGERRWRRQTAARTVGGVGREEPSSRSPLVLTAWPTMSTLYAASDTDDNGDDDDDCSRDSAIPDSAVTSMTSIGDEVYLWLAEGGASRAYTPPLQRPTQMSVLWPSPRTLSRRPNGDVCLHLNKVSHPGVVRLQFKFVAACSYTTLIKVWHYSTLRARQRPLQGVCVCGSMSSHPCLVMCGRT